MKPAFSSLRVRPGVDGNAPLAAGTVVTWPARRSGISALKRFAPSLRSAVQFSSSRPSSDGIVRASWTPIAAESSAVHGAGSSCSSSNSCGRSAGFAFTTAR